MTTISTKTETKAAATPPPNTQRIVSSLDMPRVHKPARFQVTKPEGRAFKVTASMRKRQVLGALMVGPVFCASPARTSATEESE